MWVEGVECFGPIQPFDRIELPSLTILIGANGSGKTNLLRGIKYGNILSSHYQTQESIDLKEFEADIIYASGSDTAGNISFPNAIIELRDIMNEPVSAFDPDVHVAAAYHQIVESRDKLEAIIVEATGQSVVERFSSFQNMLAMCGHYLDEIFQEPAPEGSDSLRERVMNEAGRALPYLRRYLPPFINGARADRLVEQWSYQILDLTHEQLRKKLSYYWGNIFNVDITNIFREYRDRMWRNQVQKYTDESEGTNLAFGSEEIEAAFGTPPWELVSQQLCNFGLGYSVIAPSGNPVHPVQFQLRREGSADRVDVGQLSTGERTILRLALAGFQMGDRRMNANRAGLVLLDELDASLHPDNVRRLLDAVQTGFIEGLGADCIITTHSPSTVAMAPDNAFLEIDPDSRRPKRITKQKAMDRLTAGLPMLSINYTLRRQVFTESDVDMKHYSMLYDIVRPLLSLPRTLSFIGSGSKGSCAFVSEMVRHMEQNDNSSVYGIVDWDLKNSPSDRVHVIGLNEYYSKDNIMIHPILIAALLIKQDKAEKYSRMKYSQIVHASQENLQELSDAIVTAVGLPRGSGTETKSTMFHNGIQVDVPVAYLEMNGHRWEERVLGSITPFGNKYKPNGPLITDIIEKVISDLPGLCPMPIVEVFRSVAMAETVQQG